MGAKDSKEMTKILTCSCGNDFWPKPEIFIGKQFNLRLYNCPKCGSTRAVKEKK